MRLLVSILCLFTLGAAAAAQVPDLDPEKPDRHPPVPTVTFVFDLPGATPSHYALVVEHTGRAAYRSDSPQAENASYSAPGKAPAGDPFVERFVVSQETADRIFDRAKNLNYFNGDFDYKKTRVANTGAKTLMYADPVRHFEATFNWSQTPEIMALTKLFQNISSTLEYSRRLQHQLRYQKLALDGELKQLQESKERGDVAELQLISHLLDKIANDNSVLHIVRRRAQKLLESLAGTGAR